MKRNNKDFVLLITGTSDNDNAVRVIIPPEQELISCKLEYVPPYEEFKGIRKLQEKLFASQYVKGRTVSCSVDISEWIGHEDEEYFILVLKYLHDHRSRINCVFTVGKHTENEARYIYFRLRCYLRGSVTSDLTFRSVSALSTYIRGKGFSHGSAQLLAELIMDDRMSELRSYPVTDLICDEAREFSGCGTNETVSAENTISYLRSIDSLPFVLDSGVTERIVGRYEKELAKAC